jgi:hypothetical protein
MTSYTQIVYGSVGESKTLMWSIDSVRTVNGIGTSPGCVLQQTTHRLLIQPSYSIEDPIDLNQNHFVVKW